VEEILHHQTDGENPINKGINHLSTGAGFLASTVTTILSPDLGFVSTGSNVFSRKTQNSM